MPKKATTDALEVLHRRFYAGKAQREKALDAARANDDIGRKVAELRAAAGLTQSQLAKMIGTTPSVVSRLEDANYHGHSLALLRRIAAALNRRVEVRFVPTRKSA